MKNWKKSVFVILTLCSSFASADSNLESLDIEAISKSLGHFIVRQLDRPGIAFDLDKVIQGIRDEQVGKPAPMTMEEYEQTIALIQEHLFLELAQANLSQANEFLKHNAKEEGVICVDEQLQYKVAKEGKGEKVGADSIPLVHYKGHLIDDTVFATSYDSGKPISLPIKQSIPGFSKGLVGMKEGEKRILYIHPELAYGVSGHLPPNSLLIFEVEVVEADTRSEAIAQEEK